MKSWFSKISDVEEILAPYQRTLGKHYLGYRNHVYRMIYCSYALSEDSNSAFLKEKIVIAACFHDLGMWVDQTVAYIEPSVRLAEQYLSNTGRRGWAREIGLMISEHHKLSAYKGEYQDSVEIFRRGDLVDFSLGIARFGLSRHFYRQLCVAYPNQGFHLMLFGEATKWFLKHPMTMPPFMKR